MTRYALVGALLALVTAGCSGSDGGGDGQCTTCPAPITYSLGTDNGLPSEEERGVPVSCRVPDFSPMTDHFVAWCVDFFPGKRNVRHVCHGVGNGGPTHLKDQNTAQLLMAQPDSLVVWTMVLNRFQVAPGQCPDPGPIAGERKHRNVIRVVVEEG